MKNILFSLMVLFGIFVNAQIKPNHDGVNLTPLTTTEIQALSGPLEGDLQYNSTTETIWRYNGTAWADIGAVGGGDLSQADIDTFSELNTIVTDETLLKGSDIGVTVQGHNANTDLDSTDDLVDSDLIDDDTFATATPTNIPSAESVKAYVDANSGGGTSDHGALTGLGDDDHTQYHNDTRAAAWLAALYANLDTDGTDDFFLDGSRAMTGNIDAGANSLTNIRNTIYQSTLGKLFTVGIGFGETEYNIMSYAPNAANFNYNITGDYFDASSKLFKNLADPVDPQDAATRAYVLANAGGGSITDAAQVPLSPGIDIDADGLLEEDAREAFLKIMSEKIDSVGFSGAVITFYSGGVADGSFNLSTVSTDDQTASEVNIADAGGYFTGTEVEAALQETGADLASISSPTGLIALTTRTGASSDNFRQLVNNTGADVTYTFEGTPPTDGSTRSFINKSSGFKITFDAEAGVTINNAHETATTEGSSVTYVFDSSDNTWTPKIDPVSFVWTPPSASNIPTGWDLTNLQVLYNGDSQAGADGSAITTVSDEHGTIASVPHQNLVVNVASVGGDSEFDFANALAVLEIPTQAETEFTSLGGGYSMAVVLGERLNSANGQTLWAKNDKTAGTAESAIYMNETGPGNIYAEMYGYGEAAVLGALSEGDLVVMVSETNGAFNQFRFYLNGVLQHTVDTTESAERAFNWYIGAQKNGAGYADVFDGTLKVIALYSGQLTPAEQVTMAAAF